MNPTQLDQPYRLSQAVMDRVDKEAAKYPSRRAAVKSALRYCQEETGWVSKGVVAAVATFASSSNFVRTASVVLLPFYPYL